MRLQLIYDRCQPRYSSSGSCAVIRYEGTSWVISRCMLLYLLCTCVNVSSFIRAVSVFRYRTYYTQYVLARGQCTVLEKGLNVECECVHMLSPMMEITIIAILYNRRQPTILILECFSSLGLALCQ